jgi:D-threonate/D-erythronate kinase
MISYEGYETINYDKGISQKIGVIADDLTGASDTGIQFVTSGFPTTVVLNPDNINAKQIQSDVLVIDTDSRSIKSNDAYQKVYNTSKFLKEIGINQIYKKIDSTLRGHLGAEIKAVMDVFEPDFAIIVPAYPSMGRVTKNGVHYVWGVPIDKTEMAKDIYNPIRYSNITMLLNKQTQIKVGHVKTMTLGRTLGNWRAELDTWRKKQVQWLVFDAETDEDLHLIAQNIDKLPYSVVWVGSAGLAEYLSNIHFKKKSDLIQNVKKTNENTKNRIIKNNTPNGHILVVSGTSSSVTEQQIQHLIRECDFHGVKLNPLDIINGLPLNILEHYLTEIGEAYSSGKEVVLYVSPHSEQVYEQAKLKGLLLSDVGHIITNTIAELVKHIIKNFQVKGLVLTGGETAKHVCNHLDVFGIELIKELDTGIPLGRLIGQSELYVVTKAGAFGIEASLDFAVRSLKEEGEV